MTGRIINSDVIAGLRQLPEKSIHCVVTSPPYFGLRDYQVEGQIGLEETPDAYVERLVSVFREVWRVLRDDGTLWLNLGDSFAKQGGKGEQGATGQRSGRGNVVAQERSGSSRPPPGLKPKDLIGIPWRVAFALQADGWYLRRDIIWAKPNPMPESTRDRFTSSHEYIFHLSKTTKYFYDPIAAKEPSADAEKSAKRYAKPFTGNRLDAETGHLSTMNPDGMRDFDGMRNRRSVMTVTTKPFKGAHFATFPQDLVEPLILIGTPEKCCAVCGAPHIPQTEKTTEFHGGSGRAGRTSEEVNASGKWAGQQYGKNIKLGPVVTTSLVGHDPSCSCAADAIPGTVLDPFFGSGTVGLAAERHGRRWVGVELNPKYVTMAKQRIGIPEPRRWEMELL